LKRCFESHPRRPTKSGSLSKKLDWIVITWKFQHHLFQGFCGLIQDARQWLGKFNTSGLVKQTYPVFVNVDSIYGSKNGEKILIAKNSIIDCNATNIMIPVLSKEDKFLPLEISYIEMRQWKSQRKTLPCWIQLQMNPEWTTQNENISYMEFQLDELYLGKLERIFRDRNIVYLGSSSH
jgi:hypothetical protein